MFYHHMLRPLATLLLFGYSQLMIAGNTTASEPARSEQLHIGMFSQGSIEGWKNRSFAGETAYTLVTDPTAGEVLKATSHGAASGLFLERRIDLEQTPWLHWSWKTEQLFSGIDETQKEGDDFVARLYIVVDGGLIFWNTRALNYVWSSSHQRGEHWPNPFTSNATMFAVESGNKGLGQWQHYSRNVREDLYRLTGKDVRFIDAVAIMTDTDNAGLQATTWYGDLFFTAHQDNRSVLND